LRLTPFGVNPSERNELGLACGRSYDLSGRDGQRGTRNPLSAAAGRRRMKASVTVHIETLWTNRADLCVEAELDDPHSETTRETVSLMFETARLMAVEALGENERALFGQEAMNMRYRELDEREIRLDERDKPLATREEDSRARDHLADQRESEADIRERDQMEREVRRQRQE
jgi:hypothetical protein